MESVLTFLQQYHDDSDEFLDQIITSDETWVAHIYPAVIALVSLQEEIQADFVSMESAVHSVLGQTGYSSHRLPDQRSDGECSKLLRNTAEIVMGHSEQVARDAYFRCCLAAK